MWLTPHVYMTGSSFGCFRKTRRLEIFAEQNVDFMFDLCFLKREDKKMEKNIVDSVQVLFLIDSLLD